MTYNTNPTTTPNTAAAIYAQAVAVLAERTTEQLVEMAQILDAKATRSNEERKVLAWILDAIEVRHPEVTGPMSAWAVGTNPHGYTATQAMVAALGAVAR